MIPIASLTGEDEKALARVASADAPSTEAVGEALRALLAAAAASPPAPQPGASISGFGPVEILSRPGRGVTLRATDPTGDRAVVLKEIQGSTAARARVVLAQMRLARAQDPNAVAPFGLLAAEGRAWVVRPFVEGVTLEQVLATLQKESVPPDAPTWRLAAGARGGGANVTGAKIVCRIGEHAARTLAATTKAGIAHGALKPANLIVDQTVKPSIVDFGIGTPVPPYVAPEVLDAADRAAAANEAADQYALGAALWECLTRRPVFEGDIGAVEAATRKQKPDSPFKHNFKASKEMETITLALLEKDPANRYASMAALADDLDRYHRNEPIERRPPGLFKRLFG